MLRLLELFKALVTHLAPIILITSPIVSYSDQIYSMYRSRSSAGFSLDIPLIMLVASISKIFFYFGDPYDLSLFIQACNMLLVQSLLLHIALSTRAPPPDPTTTPFAPAPSPRPYNFWQWRSARPYWSFIAYVALALGAGQLLLGRWPPYVTLVGAAALAVEAVLPLPQIVANHRQRSCKGFRLSVLVNWLGGDVFKMSFFWLADSHVPLAFKLCGLFQFACDIYLGVQYVTLGDGVAQVKEVVRWVEGKVGVRVWPEGVEEWGRKVARERGWVS